MSLIKSVLPAQVIPPDEMPHRVELYQNVKRGKLRTNLEKRRAVLLALQDDEWSRWSSRKLGRLCGVSDKFVGAIRKQRIIPRFVQHPNPPAQTTTNKRARVGEWVCDVLDRSGRMVMVVLYGPGLERLHPDKRYRLIAYDDIETGE
jgi:hypothetical protein